MAQTSTHSRRGKSSRKGRGLKITIGILLVLLLLIVLNAFALNNETETAELTVEGATLVQTTSGSLQVLDTGTPQLNDYAPVNDAGTSAAEPLPIVLIHGSGGAINWWDDLIPLLNPTNRVIAIDMLGYGGSAKPDSGYSIDSQAGLISQALASLDVKSAVAVGHSLGGKVVTALAEKSPDLVAGITIIDTGPDSSFGTLTGGAKLAQMPLIGPATWRIAPDFMIRKNVSQGFAPGYDVPDKYVEDIRDMTYPAYHQSFEEQDDYSDEVPLNQRLEKTGKPLLIIFGAEDQIFSAREALSAYAAIPGVTTKLIEGSGHSPQIEAPEETATEISAFAESLLPKPEPAPKPKPEKKKKKQQKNQDSGQNKNQQQGQNKKKKQQQDQSKNQDSKQDQKQPAKAN
ncbi:MAG: alpha/beta hydrolase [Thermoleophilia bacterium]|nr:alpha/beta hydrolase [Thermoleophilia bacterium]